MHGFPNRTSGSIVIRSRSESWAAGISVAYSYCIAASNQSRNGDMGFRISTRLLRSIRRLAIEMGQRYARSEATRSNRMPSEWKERQEIPDPQVKDAADRYEDSRRILEAQGPGSGVRLPLTTQWPAERLQARNPSARTTDAPGTRLRRLHADVDHATGRSEP